MSSDDIAKLLIAQSERAMKSNSEERKEQTREFSKALHGLRTELRVLMLTAIVILGGVAGVSLNLEALGIEAHARGSQLPAPTILLPGDTDAPR